MKENKSRTEILQEFFSGDIDTSSAKIDKDWWENRDVKVKKTSLKVMLEDGAILPQKKHEDDAGADIHSFEDVTIPVGETVGVRTGLRFHIPRGFELQLRSRSGLALKNGIFILNGVGTIDSGYLGEVRIILHNLGKEDFVIKKGDRIAQMILAPLVNMPVEVVTVFEDTERGEGGFGSTGMR